MEGVEISLSLYQIGDWMEMGAYAFVILSLILLLYSIIYGVLFEGPSGVRTSVVLLLVSIVLLPILSFSGSALADNAYTQAVEDIEDHYGITIDQMSRSSLASAVLDFPGRTTLVTFKDSEGAQGEGFLAVADTTGDSSAAVELRLG